jgi:hypothetical protein
MTEEYLCAPKVEKKTVLPAIVIQKCYRDRGIPDTELIQNDERDLAGMFEISPASFPALTAMSVLSQVIGEVDEPDMLGAKMSAESSQKTPVIFLSVDECLFRSFHISYSAYHVRELISN